MVLGTTEILQLEILFRKQTEIARGLQSSVCYNLSQVLCSVLQVLYTFSKVETPLVNPRPFKPGQMEHERKIHKYSLFSFLSKLL